MSADFGFGLDGTGQQQTMMNGIANPSSSMVQRTKEGAAEAMEFQLWVSEQAHNLSKLKVFQAMAKKVNDA